MVMEANTNVFWNYCELVAVVAFTFGVLCSGSVFADDSSDKSVFEEWDATKEKSKRLVEIISALGGEPKLRVSSHARDIPDLYRPAPDRPGRFELREKTVTIGDAFNTNVGKDEYITFNCAPHDNVFYVKHRFELRDPANDRVFGPFSGNPLEKFPEIERHMLKRISNSDTNPFIEMRRIARVGHPELNARIVKLVDKALFLPLELEEKLTLVRNAKQVLATNAAQVEEQARTDHDLEKRLAAIEKKLASFREQADDMRLEFPDEDYITAEDMKNVPQGEVEESLWGEPVAGLQFAVVPEKTLLKLEEQVHVKLVVQNVSDEEIKFCVHDVIQDVRPEVTFAGKRVNTGGTWFSGWPPTSRYRLQPGDRITLAGSHIVAHTESADKSKENLSGFGVTAIPVSGRALAADMAMKVDYTLMIGYSEAWVRGDDDVMRIYSPAKGEWTGSLDAGGFQIKFER